MSDFSSQNGQRKGAFSGAYKDLWGAVVMQARDDILNAPLNSIEYSQAVAFFTGGGEWIKSRTAIGDFLELHHDDLVRCGRRSIDERMRKEAEHTPEERRARIARSAPARRVVQTPSNDFYPIAADDFAVAEARAG